MTMISVYSFKWYDGNSSEESTSPTMATLDAISRVNGSAIQDTRMDVDASRVDHSGILMRDPGN